MRATPRDILAVLVLLRDTPRRLATACSGLDESRLRKRPTSGAWSAQDILAHLRACADVWGDSIHAILDDQHPAQPYLHPRARLRQTDYPDLPFDVSLVAFTEQRRILLDRLARLDDAEWERGVLIKGREHTVFTQARRMALHEVEHMGQVEALVVDAP